MKELIKYILEKIKPLWEKENIIYYRDGLNHRESISFHSIFKKAMELSKVINGSTSSSKKLKVALYARNSIEWIISFFGIIISNNTLVIIPASLELEKVERELTISGTSVLITDVDKSKIKHYKTFIRKVISTDEIGLYSGKKEGSPIYPFYRELVTNSFFGKSGDDIIIYSPNWLTEVKISFSEILVLLTELKERKRIFKEDNYYIVNIEFSYNYILGMLLPLICGTKVVIPTYIYPMYRSGIKYSLYHFLLTYKPSTVILTADQFTILFNEVTIFYEKKISLREIIKAISLIKSYKSILILKSLIIKVRLIDIFQGLEKLIILNSSLAFHIEKFLQKVKFPYTVTYGTVETCGIATYTNPKSFKIESVGRSIIGNIRIINDRIYHVNTSKKSGYELEDLKDIGHKDEDENIYFVCRNSKYSMQSLKITETLRRIPLISDCALCNPIEKDEKNPYLLVNVNWEYAELKGLKEEFEVRNVLKSLISKAPLKISKIIILRDQLKRDPNGNISLVNVQL